MWETKPQGNLSPQRPFYLKGVFFVRIVYSLRLSVEELTNVSVPAYLKGKVASITTYRLKHDFGDYLTKIQTTASAPYHLSLTVLWKFPSFIIPVARKRILPSPIFIMQYNLTDTQFHFLGTSDKIARR